MNLLSHEPLRKSIELFSGAIALDPSFEAAYVARANAYRLIMSYFDTPSEVLPMVVSSVQGALARSRVITQMRYRHWVLPTYLRGGGMMLGRCLMPRNPKTPNWC